MIPSNKGDAQGNVDAQGDDVFVYCILQDLQVSSFFIYLKC